jgi:amidase
VSAREAVSAHLDRIARVNPSVNAIVTLVAEQAMERARLADDALARGAAIGPLHGFRSRTRICRSPRGSARRSGRRFTSTSSRGGFAARRSDPAGAGAILVGKTNTPEFGAGSQTFNPVFGATRNPYDTTKTCGGSSGGAAVALACGMLPLADGSDMGGSLRNPASFCSVVGFRPSPGRVPTWPARLPWSPLSVDGPMARNVADVALLLSAIAGPDARSPIALGEAGRRFAGPLDRDVDGVRVAWWRDLGGVPFDPVVRQVVNDQRAVFESLGCIVEDAEPDFTGADDAFKTLRAVAFAAGYRDLLASDRARLKDTIQWELERGGRLTADDIAKAEVLRTDLYHRMRQFFERYEFFVLPTVQVPPFDVERPYPTEIAGVRMDTYIDWMKSCYYISVASNPAISVPCGYTAEGLPIGLQIVARHHDDWGLLQIAHAFEQAARIHTPASLVVEPNDTRRDRS